MGWLRVGALAVLVSIGWSSARANADDGTAALLPFQGPQAAKVRQNVQKRLRAKGVNLVPLKQVNAVAKKTQGYAKRAARLKATVLVRTRMRRVEGRWIAVTEVRNAKGQRMKRLQTSSSSLTRVSNRVVGQLMATGLMPTAAAAEPVAEEEEVRAPTQPRLVVRPFKGAQAKRIRGATVRSLLEEPVELYPNGKFVSEARSLGVDLSTEGGHVAPATKLAVSGLFEGDVLREEGIWSAYIRLVDGRSSKVVTQHYYESSTLTGLTKVVQNNVGSDFSKDIRKLGVLVPGSVAVAPVAVATAPPVEEDPKKDEAVVTTKAVETTKKKKRKKDEDRPAAVDIEADFRLVQRRLRYNDTLPDTLPPEQQRRPLDYTLNAGPGVGLKFQWFPGAHATAGVGAQFGLDFEWERLFGIDSKNENGTSFPTEAQQFLVDFRWRYPTRRWEPFVVIGYGVQTFRIDVATNSSGETVLPGVPSVKYEFVRFGAGFRVELGKKNQFILGGNIAFRGVFRLGGIGSQTWFPEATGNGMDTGVLVGFALPKDFEIRLGVDYRRYGLDLNPVPSDAPYVAGGAIDSYVGFTVGFAWRH
jgi:hypothetical protein